jgi:hypothetical protein
MVRFVWCVEDESCAWSPITQKVHTDLAKAAVDEIAAGGSVAGAPGGDDDAPFAASGIVDRPLKLHLREQLLAGPPVLGVPIVLGPRLFVLCTLGRLGEGSSIHSSGDKKRGAKEGCDRVARPAHCRA